MQDASHLHLINWLTHWTPWIRVFFEQSKVRFSLWDKKYYAFLSTWTFVVTFTRPCRIVATCNFCSEISPDNLWFFLSRGAQSWCQVTVVTNFYMVLPNSCGSSVWNLLQVSLPTPKILKLLLDFCKICSSMLWGMPATTGTRADTHTHIFSSLSLSLSLLLPRSNSHAETNMQ